MSSHDTYVDGASDPTGAAGRKPWPRRTLAACAALLVLLGGLSYLAEPDGPGLILVAVGLAGPALLVLLFKLVPRRQARPDEPPPASRTSLVLVAVLLLASVAVGISLLFGATAPPPSETVTVAYHGEGRLDGDVLRLTEEVVLDEAVRESLTRTQARYGGDVTFAVDTMRLAGWQRSGTVDGHAVYTRTREVAVETSVLTSVTVALRTELGSLAVDTASPVIPTPSATATGASVPTEPVTYHLELAPREGSTLEVTAPRGALGATFPSTDIVDNLGREDSATFELDNHSGELSILVLPPVLRNPAGQAAYQVISWGPFTWLLGSLALLIGSLLVDSLRTALGQAGSSLAGRLFNRPAAASVPAQPLRDTPTSARGRGRRGPGRRRP